MGRYVNRAVRKAISVYSDTASDGQTLASALDALGVQVNSHGSLSLCSVRDIWSDAILDWNRQHLEIRRAWMLVKPGGTQQWVGPLFIPGQTGCFECLRHRLRENRWQPDLAERKTYSPLTLTIAATEASRWIEQKASSSMAGKLLEVRFDPFRTYDHYLIRRPNCPTCGHARARTSPVALDALVSELTGIASGLTKPAGKETYPVFVARHVLPVPPQFPAGALRLPLGVVSGKGQTEAASRMSCLAEAVERYSIHFHGDEELHRACSGDPDPRLVNPASLLLFSPAQYARRSRWNIHRQGFQWTPEPWDPRAELDWLPAWSVSEGRARLVPAAYCLLNYPARWSLADSNGCAAGETRESAVCQAFCELVERDAAAIWWYNRLDRPGLDLEDASLPEWTALKQELAGLDRTLHVLDITHDFGIPTFVAVSAKTKSGRKVLFGMGTHLVAEVAVRRALSELMQILESIGDEAWSKSGRLSANERDVRRWLRAASLANQPHLVPKGSVKISRHRTASTGEPKRDQRILVECAAKLGLETIVVDLTRRDLGLPVVRVIVPGMRHIWARFGLGRLYDVPVRMGWRRRPLREQELNPIPFFL